jgi:hypothetical protein
VKASISVALIFIWTPIAVQLAPDTSVGVAIILAPDVLFLVAAFVFVSNGLSRK